jgi:uncharacterized RDD family membrane protein YckC
MLIKEIENLSGMDRANVADELPQVYYPWRRYLARVFDGLMYSILWAAFLAFVFHVNVVARNNAERSLDGFITTLMMLFLEPLLLHLFGTTPGKATFGLRIENPDGSRLSYTDGLVRTWGVLSRGMGFNIPIYNIIRLLKIYNLCIEKETLPWDESLSYTIKDTKWYRGVIYVGATLAAFAVFFTISSAQQLPPNKGDINVAEFAENYNYYAKLYKIDFGNEYLDKDGKWAEKDTDGTVIYISFTEKPEYNFTIEKGYVTGVSFDIEMKNHDYMIGSYDKHMLLASLAFAGAQNEMGLFSKIPRQIADNIVNNSFEGYHFVEAGIVFDCDIEYSGYYRLTNILVPSENAKDNYFSIKFSMNKK